MNIFTASDLPASEAGDIYHLNTKRRNIAPDIIIVGDPDRVAAIAGRPNLCFGGELVHGDPWRELCRQEVGRVAEALLSEIECDFCHRGLRTITGISAEHGNRVTVTTSGMGTPSLEIVLNEIIALNEVDFTSRQRRAEWGKINIIRVGTSGGLRSETALGTAIVAEFAVGLDGAGFYYDVPGTPELTALEDLVEQALVKSARPDARFGAKLKAYAAQSDSAASAALLSAAAELNVKAQLGITVSNGGFFAAQGRDVGRAPLTVPDIDNVIANLDPKLKGLRFENMEMESALLFHLMGAHQYSAGAVCIAIANRRDDTFDHDYQTNVLNSTRVALLALAKMREG